MKFTTREIILTGMLTAITAVFAQISIAIPFSPVPITMTLFAVFLGSIVTGAKCGVFSQLIYILLGICGLPVFQGFHGGLDIILGPKGGYIISFPLMALVIGIFTEGKKNISKARLICSMSLSLLICYILGAAWLGTVLGLSLSKAAVIGVLPYIPLDVLKLFLAAFIGYEARVSLIKAGLLTLP